MPVWNWKGGQFGSPSRQGAQQLTTQDLLACVQRSKFNNNFGTPQLRRGSPKFRGCQPRILNVEILNAKGRRFRHLTIRVAVSKDSLYTAQLAISRKYGFHFSHVSSLFWQIQDNEAKLFCIAVGRVEHDAKMRRGRLIAQFLGNHGLGSYCQAEIKVAHECDSLAMKFRPNVIQDAKLLAGIPHRDWRQIGRVE